MKRRELVDMPRRLSLGRLVNQSTMLLMVIIGVLILVLALLILFHENRNATKGYDLRNLEVERSAFYLEQEVLNMQIAEAQALEKLRDDPQIVSMVSVRNPRYIDPRAKPASSASSSSVSSQMSSAPSSSLPT